VGNNLFNQYVASFRNQAQLGSPLTASATALQPTLMDQFTGKSDPFGQSDQSQVGFLNDFTSQPFGSPSGGGSFQNAFTSGGFGSGGAAFGNSYTQGAGAQQGFGQQTGQAGGALSNAGGAWASLDQLNPEIGSAANQYGVPPNLLKSMINNESSGNWARDGSRVVGLRGERMLPFVGIFESTARSWGLDFDAMIGNKEAQIAGMAKILSGLSSQYGGYDNAVKVYFGGTNALNGNWKDENGLGSNDYYNKAITNWHSLDQQSGSSGGYGDGGTGTGIVQEALQYVGVPYVWGSLPGVGDNPWQTGWDCSAFIDYLDNKYGNNELPAGSHYQYQDTINKGLLIQDPNQLQAGDLVFFDTGNTAGGGAELNRAGHVGMYIGNGQFIQAANPGAGTIVSDLGQYIQMYGFLGGRKMGWSGGGGGATQAQRPSFSNLVQKYLMKQ
jgi:cell wall-associated NlpC family hydrolase